MDYQVKKQYRGQFPLIYADPPWRYGSRGARGGWMGELDYQTMTIRDLMALPVADLAPKDGLLLMWTTGSFMMDAGDLGKAWGYPFVRVDRVWAKVKESGKPHGVPGPWGFTDAEFLLLFVRGKMHKSQAISNQRTMAWEQPYPGTHSAKPNSFRDDISTRFPGLRSLELFSRNSAPGWESWGNEAPGGLDLFEPADPLGFLEE